MPDEEKRKELRREVDRELTHQLKQVEEILADSFDSGIEKLRVSMMGLLKEELAPLRSLELRVAKLEKLERTRAGLASDVMARSVAWSIVAATAVVVLVIYYRPYWFLAQ